MLYLYFSQTQCNNIAYLLKSSSLDIERFWFSDIELFSYNGLSLWSKLQQKLKLWKRNSAYFVVFGDYFAHLSFETTQALTGSYEISYLTRMHTIQMLYTTWKTLV